MKTPLLLFSGLVLTSLFSPAAPLAVGAVSNDIGFSEGTVFAGGRYTTLEQRRLSDFPDRVLVLVYFTPW